MNRFLHSAAAFLGLTVLALAQGTPHPDGYPLPHGLTAAEQAWLRTHPLGSGTDRATPPPTGPVSAPAEYERMDGILMSWEGPSSWTTILAKMAAQITTVGDADVYMTVETAGEQASAQATLTANGTNLARVRFVLAAQDSIWIRDYGPRYIFQGNCRAIVDHTYNRPRPNDDRMPTVFSGFAKHAFYEHALIHGGGNYHLSGLSDAHATRLIVNENPGRTEAEIVGIWQSYLNVVTTLYTPFPISVDATQHIDMWMQITDPRTVVISDWPFNVGSVQDQICDAAALAMQATGYTVHRVVARSVGGVHYTWTNVVMCNNLVLIPSFTNATAAAHNAAAVAVFQAACPGKTVVAIDAQAIISAAGVLHCIVMHVPEHRGGVNPTAYLETFNGGEVLTPGQQVSIDWVTDDDVLGGVAAVDLWLSTDGGQSFPTLVASGLPSSGPYSWTVPDVCSGIARLRVVARDGNGNTGSDDSDGDFAIAGTGCVAANIAYGAGKPGTLGLPLIAAAALPQLGTSWTLNLAQFLPNATAALLVGATTASLPFDGATVLVAPVLGIPVAVDGGGLGVFAVGIPTQGSLAGQSLYWQAWMPNDPLATGLGFACSAGLQMRLGY